MQSTVVSGVGVTGLHVHVVMASIMLISAGCFGLTCVAILCPLQRLLSNYRLI
jgi:hypothetical protein